MATETMDCPFCGEEIKAVALKCKHCGELLNTSITVEQPETKICRFCGENVKFSAVKCKYCNEFFTTADSDSETSDIIRKIYDMERISNWLWIIVGILQIISVVFALIGFLNLIGALYNRRRLPQILNRNAELIKEYEPLLGLIIFGLINFFFGGFIGVALVIFDAIIRDKVLSNKHLFSNNTNKR